MKKISIVAFAFMMSAFLALPVFAQVNNSDFEDIVTQFEETLNVNLIPNNMTGQQLVPFLNVAIKKRNIEIVKEILGRGVDLQGSEDIYYQDPLLIALSNGYDTESSLDIDKEIMTLLVENGADMTKRYLTPYQEYYFGLISLYLHGTWHPSEISPVNKKDRYNVISIATGYVTKHIEPYYIEKFLHLLNLGSKKDAINQIDMRAFAAVVSKYHEEGEKIMDVLLNNNMIVEGEHIQIVKNLIIDRQRELPYKTGFNKLPLSSEKVKEKYMEKTHNPVLVAMWTKEFKEVEKDEKLISRLEQMRAEQQEMYANQVVETTVEEKSEVEGLLKRKLKTAKRLFKETIYSINHYDGDLEDIEFAN